MYVLQNIALLLSGRVPVPPSPSSPSPGLPSGVTDSNTIDGASSIANTGPFVLLVIIGIIVYFVMQSNKKKSKKEAIEAYRPLAEPLYTPESGKIVVYAGWYPIPDGTQDRYHNGEDWTEHYRVHTDEGKLGDDAPEGVTVTTPEPIKNSEVPVTESPVEEEK